MPAQFRENGYLELPTATNNLIKAIPLKLFYHQTFLKLGVINIHDMNIKKVK